MRQRPQSTNVRHQDASACGRRGFEMKNNTDDGDLYAFGTELKAPYFTAAGWVSPLNFLPEVRA